MGESNSSFLRANLDKFVLLLVFAMLLPFCLHTGHDKDDINSGLAQFSMQITGQVMAALLTLLTIGSKKGQSNAQTLAEAREDTLNAGGKVTETVHKTVDVKTESPINPPPPKSETKE